MPCIKEKCALYILKRFSPNQDPPYEEIERCALAKP